MGIRPGQAKGPAVSAGASGGGGTITGLTPPLMPFATSATTLGNSGVSWIVGSSTMNIAGSFSVATNKFTVAQATGNTLIAGTLGVTGNFAVNTNKFTVVAASGNTLIAGTLGVTGDFAVNTNKFTVTAGNGNFNTAGDGTVQGSLDVTSTTTLRASAFVFGLLTLGSPSKATWDGFTGDLAIQTNRFTVAGATGNTLIAGTLNVTGDVAVNTTKFTVTAATGDFVSAGVGTIGDGTNASSPLVFNGYNTGNAAAPSAGQGVFWSFASNSATAQAMLSYRFNDAGTSKFGRVRLSFPGDQGAYGGTYRAVNADTAATAGDSLLKVDTGSADVTVTLPNASDMDGQIINVKKIAGSANVILARTGADTIDGATSLTFGTLYQNVQLQADANVGAWWVL